MAPREQTKLDAGRLLAGLGGLLLLVSLFLDWYGDGFGEAISGWSSFELLDVVLALLALVAIYAALEAMLPDRWPAVSATVARAAGPLALLLVVVSIIDKPPVLLFTEDPQLEAGIWIALAATLAMTAGAALSRVRVSFVISPRREEPRGAEPPASSPGL